MIDESLYYLFNIFFFYNTLKSTGSCDDAHVFVLPLYTKGYAFIDYDYTYRLHVYVSTRLQMCLASQLRSDSERCQPHYVCSVRCGRGAWCVIVSEARTSSDVRAQTLFHALIYISAPARRVCKRRAKERKEAKLNINKSFGFTEVNWLYYHC